MRASYAAAATPLAMLVAAVVVAVAGLALLPIPPAQALPAAMPAPATATRIRFSATKPDPVRIYARLPGLNRKRAGAELSQLVHEAAGVRAEMDLAAGRSAQAQHGVTVPARSSGSGGRRRRDSCDTAASAGKHPSDAYVNLGSGVITLVTLYWVGPFPAYYKHIVMLLTYESDSGRSYNVKYSSDGGASYQPRPELGLIRKDGIFSEGNMVYALADGQDLFVSDNLGMSFKRITTSAKVSGLKINPQFPEMVLAEMPDRDRNSDSEPLYGRLVVLNNMSLVQQSDEASSLAVEDFVISYDWVTSRSADEDPAIFIVRYDSRPTTDSVPQHLYRWEAPFYDTVPVNVKENGFDFLQVDEFTVAYVSQYRASNAFHQEMHVSTDGRTFRQAVFPTKHNVKYIDIVDASENAIVATIESKRELSYGDYNATVTLGDGSLATARLMKDIISETPAGFYERQYKLIPETTNPSGCSVTGGVFAKARGAIVLLERGSCKFVEKIFNAKQQGALGVVIVDTGNANYYIEAPNAVELPGIPAFVVSNDIGTRWQKDTGIMDGRGLITFGSNNNEFRELWAEQYLYVSDRSGIVFTQSMEGLGYLPRTTERDSEVIDVYKVESQNGTYIAYQQDGYNPRTVVSYNKGGYWQFLDSPTGSSCTKPCHFHMVLASSQKYFVDTSSVVVALPMSSLEAPGIILANGNVGEFVATNIHDVHAYLSTDGGGTWNKIYEEPCSFHILDHGSVLVAAPSKRPGSTIRFSLDRGQTWTNQTFAREAPSSVEDDDDSHTVTYNLLGVLSASGASMHLATFFYRNGEWALTDFNFQGLLSRSCTDSTGDYETYNAQSRDGCLLGERVFYKRRKPCVACHNGVDHEKATSSEHERCACQLLDLACGPGFLRAQDKTKDFMSAACVPMQARNYDPQSCAGLASSCGAPYRRVADLGCTANDDFVRRYFNGADDSDVHPGGPTSGPSSKKGSVGAGMTVVVLLSIAIMCGAILIFSQNARSTLIRVFGVEEGCLGKVGGCFSHLSCFRVQNTYKYSQLKTNVYEDGIDADEEDEYDDDNILFALDDEEDLDGA